MENIRTPNALEIRNREEAFNVRLEFEYVPSHVAEGGIKIEGEAEAKEEE